MVNADVLTRQPEAPADFGGTGKLDFKTVLLAAQFDHQIQLSTSRGAIKAHIGPLGQQRANLFNNETFP